MQDKEMDRILVEASQKTNHATKEIVFEGNCEEIMRVDNGPNGQLRVRVRLVNEQGDSRIQEISSVSRFNREVIDGYKK